MPEEFAGDIPVVGGAAVAPQHHSSLIIATQDPQADTEDNPDGPDDTQLMSLDSRTGAVSWDHQGAVATGLVPALQGDTVLSVAADDTAYRYRIADGSPEGVEPLPGDLYTGVQAAVRAGDGPGTKKTDRTRRGQSRGVFALDRTPTTGGTPHYLWTATVQGSVHQIEAVDGGQEVLVSSSGGWDLIDVRTGRVLTAVSTPGVLTWTATPIQTKSGLEVVVPTTSLTAYAPSGRVLWRYTPSGDPVRFADVATDANGQVISEYGTGWGDGRVHDDAVLTPTGEESGPDFGGSTSIPGYIPAQLEANLDLTGTGAGQAVAIIDAYDHPLIETEPNGFSKQFGLTQTCDTVAAGAPCVDFTVDQMPDMRPQSDDWDMETALDSSGCTPGPRRRRSCWWRRPPRTTPTCTAPSTPPPRSTRPPSR